MDRHGNESAPHGGFCIILNNRLLRWLIRPYFEGRRNWNRGHDRVVL